MSRIVLVIFLIISTMASANINSDDILSRATAAINLINARDFHGLWNFVSDKSKFRVKKQLLDNKRKPAGRYLISSVLGVPNNKIDSLTTEDYFVAIMNADKTAGKIRTEIIRIDQGDKTALIHWKKGLEEGTSSMVNEHGTWYVILDAVSDQN